MKNLTVLLIASAGLLVHVPSRAADDSPMERYQLDIACAGLTSAALTRPAPTLADKKIDIQSLATYYAGRAQTSGKVAGLTPPKVDHDIDAFRRGITDRMQGSDAAKADAEKIDNAAMVQKCAELPFFEAVGHVAK